MSIGLVGKTARLHLKERNPKLATGRTAGYAGDAQRRRNLKQQQRMVSRYGTTTPRSEIREWAKRTAGIIHEGLARRGQQAISRLFERVFRRERV